jgi:hypothetical protein
MLLQPLSYARMVSVEDATDALKSELNPGNARQGLQWPNPTRLLISIIYSITVDMFQTYVQGKAVYASRSFRQPLPEPDGVVRAGDSGC